jgi:hypothetical protein
VLFTCRPPRKRWNEGRNNTLFMILLAVTLFFVFIPLSIALRVYQPNCGPHQDLAYLSIYDSLWDFVKV